MLVISRFRYPETDSERATAELQRCWDRLAATAGFRGGTVGRSVDDPTLWVLETRWDNVGAYRRALSSYDVKLHAVPLLSHAIDEPSAYEIVVGEGAVELNERKPRGSESGPGR